MTSLSYRRKAISWPTRLLLAALLACVVNRAWAAPPTLTADFQPLTLSGLLAADVPGASGEDDLPPGLRPEPPPAPALTEKEQPAPVIEDERSVFTTWWFWALAVGLVAGTVALGVMASDSDQPTPARACMAGYICFGDGR